jgi:hypothetical protein
MYTREQQEKFQQTFQQERERISKYDENSIDKARAKWDEASALVQHIQAGGNSIYDIHEAHQKESEARSELDDAVKYSSHLQLAKRQREIDAAKEAERKKELQENAVAEKAAFRQDAKERWLAVGGTEHSFNEQYESLWIDELKRRTMGHKNMQEQMVEDLRKSGKYH